MAGRLGGTRECYETPISKRLSPGRYYHIAVQKRLLDFFVQCNIWVDGAGWREAKVNTIGELPGEM